MIRTRLCTQTSAATLHFIDMLQKTGFNAIIWCNFYLLRGSQCFMQAFVAHKCIEFIINHQKQEGYWTYNIDVYDEIIFSSPTINISERPLCVDAAYNSKNLLSSLQILNSNIGGFLDPMRQMTWEVQIHPSYFAAWSPSPIAHQLLKRLQKKHESRVGVLCFFEFMVWINFLLSRFIFSIKFKINSLLPPLNS